MTKSPPLRVSARWTFAVAAGIVLLAALSIASEMQFAARRIGVSFELHAEGGMALVAVAPDSPASRAGLAPGDRLLSLQGQPLRELGDYDRIADAAPEVDELVFEVARNGDARQARVRPGMPPDLLTLVVQLLVAFAYLAIGLVALPRGVDDRRAILLAAFSFAVALELAMPNGYAMPAVSATVIAVAFRLLTGLQFGLELHLASMIPSPLPWLERDPRRVRGLYVIGLGLGLFAAAALLAERSGWGNAATISHLADELLLTWMLPIWALAVVALIGWRAARHPEPRGRHQAWLVLLGLAPWVAIVLFGTAAGIFGFEGAVPDIAWSLALLAYPVAIFVAIFLYRLFDLELVVKRTFVFGTLTTLLVLTFYALVGAGGALFARQLDGPGAPIWVVSAATLVLGLLFNPLRLRLERLIDRRIFPERQALRSRLVGLAAELPAQGKLERMAEHLARELGRIFGVAPVAVWIAVPPHGQLVEHAASERADVDVEPTALIAADDPAIRRIARDGRPASAAALSEASPALASRLVGSGAELVVPLLAQERLVGLLLVGAKRDRARFVAEEMELLALLGHHVATVFENARLFDSATFEGLTGLFRREAILEILDREWNRSQRYDRPLAIAIADLDRFKAVNDRYGHLGGDLVLQRIAAELKSQLRETDFIGRFGGEEFLMVLPETTLEGARSFAEKARRRIERLEVRLEQGERVAMTVSLGVASRAEIQAGPLLKARALIAAADEALYAAKRAGRNRVEVAAAARGPEG